MTHGMGHNSRGARGDGKNPLAISKVDNRATASGASSFTSINFGAAEDDRVLVAGISLVAQSPMPNTTVCTIGGVSATLLSTSTHSPANALTRVVLFGAVVPSGTSGTVAFTFSPGTLRSGLDLYSVLGGASLVPHDTIAATNGSTSGTLNIPAGGVALAHVGHTSGASAVSWTGLTERYDAAVTGGTYYSGACDAFTDEELNRTITANLNGSAYARAMSAVSLGHA